MKTLINFSHPLSPAAKAGLTQARGEFEEIIIPCHLDLERPLAPQVDDLWAESPVALEKADMVIPPALSGAAYLLAARHLVSSRPGPEMIWVKRAGSPPGWVLGGIE